MAVGKRRSQFESTLTEESASHPTSAFEAEMQSATSGNKPRGAARFVLTEQNPDELSICAGNDMASSKSSLGKMSGFWTPAGVCRRIIPMHDQSAWPVEPFLGLEE